MTENEVQTKDIETDESFYYRFGITQRKFDYPVFGIRLELLKASLINLPCIVLDFYKYSYSFGWCEINDKKEILK